MPDTFTPIRQALGDAYMGDTKAALALGLSSPATFDQRIIDHFVGLGQGIETPLPSAITGQNLKDVMAALHATDNAQRVAMILRLLERTSEAYEAFNFDPQKAFLLTEIVLGSGYVPFKKGLTVIGVDTSPTASVMLRRHPVRGVMFDFNIPFQLPVPPIEHLTGGRFKFGLIVEDGDTFHLPFVGANRMWVPCSLVRTARSETKALPGFLAHVVYETGFVFGGSIGTKPALTFSIATSSGNYLNWADIWTNGSFEPVAGAVANLSMTFNAL